MTFSQALLMMEDPDIIEAVDAVARSEGISRSAYIRQLIRADLRRREEAHEDRTYRTSHLAGDGASTGVSPCPDEPRLTQLPLPEILSDGG